MRADKDSRKDFIIKKEILEVIRKDFDDPEILFVVDDRPSVVKMWREEGLVCLQCAEWNEDHIVAPITKGLLTLMVGPSGAGKSTWLKSQKAASLGICQSHIISSDQIRHDLCGNFRDQTKNDHVFAAMKAIIKYRIDFGLPSVVDATNIKRADRVAMTELAGGGDVRYIVIDRPMSVKQRDAGWRAEVGFDLIAKHDETFRAQLKDIMSGDKLPNVVVIDERKS